MGRIFQSVEFAVGVEGMAADRGSDDGQVGVIAPVLAGAAVGLAAGLVASFVMAKFEQAWVPPKTNDGESATAGSARMLAGLVTDTPLTAEQARQGGTLVHYALGAGLGLVYGVAAEYHPGVTAGDGLVFGVATEVAIDQLMVPVLGLSKPFWKCPAVAHLNGLAAHLVFGAALEIMRGSARALIPPAPAK